MSEPLLRVNSIETFYGPIQAIRGVSLDVDQGQIVTVLGRQPVLMACRHRNGETRRAAIVLAHDRADVARQRLGK